MPKTHLKLDMNGQIQTTMDFRCKSKPKKYIPGIIEDYIREREIFINDELSKQWLKEHEK